MLLDANTVINYLVGLLSVTLYPVMLSQMRSVCLLILMTSVSGLQGMAHTTLIFEILFIDKDYLLLC
jgi:hypothetical protein